MFAKIEEGEVAEYPFNLNALRTEVSFRRDPPPELLAAFGVHPVAETPRPAASLIETVTEDPPVLVDDVWTQQWSSEYLPLADAKAALRAAINARRDAVFTAGYTPASGPLSGKTLQTRDIEDRTNWLTSQAAYSAAVAGGAGAVEEAAFRTADNETIVLSYTDGLGVLLGMAAWGKAVMGNSWSLKDAVEAAADIAALEAIDLDAGWP